MLCNLRNMVPLRQKFELNNTNYESIESRDAMTFSRYQIEKRNTVNSNHHMIAGRRFSDISVIVKL